MKLKISQLARCLSVNIGIVSMGVKRGYIISEGKGRNQRIDITVPENVMWLDKQKIQGRELDLNKVNEAPIPKPIKTTAKPATKDKPAETKKTSIDDLRTLEIKKRKLDIKKAEKAIELDELKIQKQKGLSIPVDAVKTLFMFTEATVFKVLGQEVESILDQFITRYGIEHNEAIATKKELNEILDSIRQQYKDECKQGIKGIVAEYQEVRGRGERK